MRFHLPAQPTWFSRLTKILAELRKLDEIPYIDRQAFERIFSVRDRRARVLMSRFHGIQVGNAWAVDRCRLIGALEGIQRGDDFRHEQQRRVRVAATYEEAKREHPARQVRIPVSRETRSCKMSSLPSGIDLGPGELCIRFTDAEDLAAKLFELSQVMAHDWDAFVDIAQPERF